MVLKYRVRWYLGIKYQMDPESRGGSSRSGRCYPPAEGTGDILTVSREHGAVGRGARVQVERLLEAADPESPGPTLGAPCIGYVGGGPRDVPTVDLGLGLMPRFVVECEHHPRVFAVVVKDNCLAADGIQRDDVLIADPDVGLHACSLCIARIENTVGRPIHLGWQIPTQDPQWPIGRLGYRGPPNRRRCDLAHRKDVVRRALKTDQRPPESIWPLLQAFYPCSANRGP